MDVDQRRQELVASVERGGAAEVGDGRLQFLVYEPRLSAAEEVVRFLPVVLYRLVEVGDGRLGFKALKFIQSAVAVRLGDGRAIRRRARVEPLRLLVVLDGAFQVALGPAGHAALEVGGRPARVN